MGLESAYDEIYSNGENERTRWSSDSYPRKRPRNRTQAIVAVPGTGDTLLDIGCGNGRLLYAHRHRFSHLVGLELSGVALSQAQTNLAGLPALLHQGSAEAMDQIASNSVDRIIASDVIEHIPDVYAAAAEMNRVLKLGGCLIVNTPNVAYIRWRLHLMMGRFPSTSYRNEGVGDDYLFDGGHMHYFTFRSLQLLLERARFTVTARMGYGRLASFYPPLLSVGVQLTAVRS
jgi:SAM-dependent methyltransferase